MRCDSTSDPLAAGQKQQQQQQQPSQQAQNSQFYQWRPFTTPPLSAISFSSSHHHSPAWTFTDLEHILHHQWSATDSPHNNCSNVNLDELNNFRLPSISSNTTLSQPSGSIFSPFPTAFTPKKPTSNNPTVTTVDEQPSSSGIFNNNNNNNQPAFVLKFPPIKSLNSPTAVTAPTNLQLTLSERRQLQQQRSTSTSTQQATTTSTAAIVTFTTSQVNQVGDSNRNNSVQNNSNSNSMSAAIPMQARGSPSMPTNPLPFQMTVARTTGSTNCCGGVLTFLSIIVFILTLPFSLFFTIKVVQEYERAVIFRLGRLNSRGAKGPGLFFILPCIDQYRCIDMRTKSYDVPPQEILTRDSVTVAVDAVVYYRIRDASVAITNVEDYQRSTHLLAATTLRTVLGTKSLAEILSDRESISQIIGRMLDDATESWGVKVERVEVKDVRLPVQMQRAMAAEAEANREARAKVIAAEGEQKASRALKEAALIMSDSPTALQLRYLQTLHDIAAEKNSTIIFPLPVEMLTAWLPGPKGTSKMAGLMGLSPVVAEKMPPLVMDNAT